MATTGAKLSNNRSTVYSPREFSIEGKVIVSIVDHNAISESDQIKL